MVGFECVCLCACTFCEREAKNERCTIEQCDSLAQPGSMSSRNRYDEVCSGIQGICWLVKCW